MNYNSAIVLLFRFKPILNFFSLVLVVSFLVAAIDTSAQKTIGKLHLKSGDVIIKENISDVGIRTELNKGKWNNQTYAVLIFEKMPTANQLEQLANSGIEFLHYLPDHAYQVRFKYTASSFILKDAGVKSVVQLTGQMKYGKKLQEEVVGFQLSSSTLNISLQLMPGISAKAILPQLTQKGFSLTKDQFINGGLLIGNVSVIQLQELASLPFISFVNLADFTPQLLNHRERGFYGLTGLTSSQGASRQLNGAGISIGVGDNADPTSHLDNQINLINRNPSSIAGSAHGSVVAGIVGGDGLIQERLTGTAPASFIVSDYFDYMVSKTPTYIADYGMTVANNSYFTGAAGCLGDGDYNELSVYIDDQIYNNPTLQHIFAVGNDGNLTCSPYPFGFGTVKSGFQTAKNTLCVGSWNVVVNIISGFSSKGPVLDGRIKPEIIASGGGVESTRLNNAYTASTGSTGTSFASPGVTGIWALLAQRYKQIHGVNPKSALLKNILCNTATERGNVGPDYSSGFGLVNAQRAVEMLEQNRYYSNSVGMSGNHAQTISVPAGTKQLKVMLYWHDKPGSPIAPNALENDLDLTVLNGVTMFTPLVLNPAPASVNAPAVQGVDHINNIEQVVIDNPATSVTINVNGFNVTASQEFFISYEFIQPELKLLYPYGGERLSTFSSTSRAEIIRWESNDNSSDTYKLEYSIDDGSTWINIVDGIPSAEFRYDWSVPAVNTNKAKVRIKRSSGSVYSTSIGNFVITDFATVTPTVPCEGYVDLNWGAVTGATDYQVMQLNNGIFSNIATTTSTTHRVNGLDRNTTYWFTVRPRIGDSLARRADAKSIVPALSSPCTNASFDNDLKIDTLVTSVTGRKFTSTQYTATQTISIRIKNLDDAPSSTGYTVSYQVNGGPVINENPGISITAGGTLDYTFSANYNFSAAGNYTLRVFVTQAGDLQTANNERNYSIRHLANSAITLPVIDDFETTGSNDLYTVAYTGLSSVDRFDFVPTTNNGRLRTYLNSGMQINGNRSIYLDAAQFNGVSNTNAVSATYNMSGVASTPGLRFDFRFRNQGQFNSAGTNYVWMRGQDNQPWVQVYNLTDNQGDLGEIKRVPININEVKSNAGQPITTSFQVKFDQSGFGTANNGSYSIDGDLDDGFAFDDLRIVAASNDLTVMQLVSPTTFNCGAGVSSNVTIRVKNTTASAYLNVPVYYRIDNGTPVAGSIASLAGNSTIDYTFSTPVNLSNYKQYDIDVWVQLPGDDYPLNDSVTNQLVFNSPVISSFPYLERFESTNGNFFTSGNYSGWKWGSPDTTRLYLKRAANGNKGWFTNLTGVYKNNENSYLYSPCYNLSSLTTPMLSFAHISRQEDNYDFHTIEFTTDNGSTWQPLGLLNGGTNWFTSAALNWQFSISRWHVSSVIIPTNASSVRFRFLLKSDVFTQAEGIGIDDIYITEAQTIYTGLNVTGITQNITGGSNWIHFTNGGNLVASINPLGQNLGSTTANVYFNTTGLTRFINGHYYMDRNIVLRSTNPLTDSVLLRFYFTETEAASMIGASSCGSSCQTITDAFVAGIYKFSGSEPVENGVIDDGSGVYEFIKPDKVDVIPFSNGYYAEFKVRSFSEFWLTGADLNIVVTPVTNIEGLEGSFIKSLYQNNGKTLFIQKGDRLGVRQISIKVFNSTGQILITKTSAYSDCSLDIGKLNPGVYIIEIIDETGKERFVKKIVKQNL